MPTRNTEPDDATALRQRAELRAAKSSESKEALSPAATRLTLHELRVHQIELEIQNVELRRSQAELDAARERYFDLYDLAPVGYCTLSASGLIHELNLAAANLLGIVRSEMVRHQDFSSFIHKDDQTRYYWFHKQSVATGKPQACELRMVKTDGKIFWAHLEAIAAQGADGAPFYRIALSDITERKRIEAYKEMGTEILHILNGSEGLQDSIRRVLATLKTQTGFDAVGLRLQDGDDFPYYDQQGFPKAFLLSENTLVGRDAEGGKCRDINGNALLECACGLVISGKADPSSPLFTRGGSFWTGDALPLLNLPPAQDPRPHPRNQCMRHGYASMALIPFRDKERIVGLLHFADRRKDCFTLATVELLEDVAAHIGEALVRKRAERDLCQSAADMHALAARLQDVREEERAALSRELHDTLGQHLTAFALQFESVCMESHALAKGPSELAVLYDKINEMVPLVERLIEQTQSICAALRPGVLDELGLVAAIEWLAEKTAKRTGIVITLSLPSEEIELDEDIALALFRIVQEALMNVARHAHATRAEVGMHASGGEWEVEIQDNGRGFTPSTRLGPKALGMLGMRERAVSFGGSVNFLSEPGKGTTVRARMPGSAHHVKTGECQ
jgi:PAS domain S-box-containing protein